MGGTRSYARAYECFAVLALIAVASLVLASPAVAAQAKKSKSSATTTATIDGYDVDFTLPTAAKSGCLVCHGDSDLARVEGGSMVSYYIDPEMVAGSAHAGVQCTGCHLDFAFTLPHKASGDWRAAAKMACRNCHRDQFLEYGRSAHRLESGEPTSSVTGTPRPLCGDCHGSHDIAMLTDNPDGQAAMHRRGLEMCGTCHAEYSDAYDDYYHGAAYRYGAKDAPVCWDCHGAHDVLEAKDKNSRVNERHLVETCSQCHNTANESYVKYARVIHKPGDVAEETFFTRWINRFRDALALVFGG